jgi:hypothetical protein
MQVAVDDGEIRHGKPVRNVRLAMLHRLRAKGTDKKARLRGALKDLDRRSWR